MYDLCSPETSEKEGPPPAKQSRLPVCCLCCGMNAEQFLSSVATKVKEKMEQTAYVVSSFALSLKFPPAIFVRQHAVSLYLGKKVCVKDVMRARLADVFTNFLRLSYHPDAKFQIGVEIDHDDLAEDCLFLASLHPSAFKTKKEHNRHKAVISMGSVQRVVDLISCQDYQDHQYWPPPPLLAPMNIVKIQFTYESIYVGGRYNKYSRTLSQTPWLIDGQRKTSTSVQELIAEPLLRKYNAEEIKFSASGREDADVRMLGEGRPFLVEIVNPHNPNVTADDLLSIEADVNICQKHLVHVRHLQVVDRASCEKLKEGEEEKRKCYCALVRCPEGVLPIDVCSLERQKNLILQQKTPVRVLHRRPLVTRERTVYSLRTESVDRHHFKLHLCTQAGTYVKEFVHGDFGRTTPSITSLLGQEADIVALDVEEVLMDWPPSSK